MSDSTAQGDDHGKGHGRKHNHGGHGGSHEEAHEGAPEWLISFADMVMLMMGFFVILFALNNKPAGRNPGGQTPETEAGREDNAEMLDLALAIREAFNNPVTVQSSNPNDAPLIRRLLQRAGKSETRDKGVKGHEREVQTIRPSDYYAISGNILFPENSSDLPDAGRSTLNEIAEKVRGMRLVVEVRGHVSSVEAAQGSEQAMRLSSDRALAAARALTGAGVDWWQLRLVLCADHERSEAFPVNRAADKPNARVEVIITDQVVPDRVPTRYAQPAASKTQ